MIAYVHGKVTGLDWDTCIVDVQGLGYRVTIPTSTREQLAMGEVVRLYTHLQVKPDGYALYGFYSEAEYEMYMLLLSVTGIGPKLACGIVSGITPTAFYEAVNGKNTALLTSVPGLGKKTVERMYLDLQNRIPQVAVTKDAAVPTTEMESDLVAETVRALVGLGYADQEVKGIVAQLAVTHTTTSTLLRAALSALGKER